jgi:hypothetical protein
MILKTEIDLNSLDCLDGLDGVTIASIIADEITEDLKRQVRRELKKDPQVTELVNRMKHAAIAKMLDSFAR